MKITEIETFIVPPRWLLLRVATDEGLVGWGEPVVEGRAETVAAAVETLGEIVIGCDPLRIEDLWQSMTRGSFYRGGPILSSAVAGVDQALWDIAGKARGAPVHELLGGPVRDRVRTYGWIGGDEPSGIADHAAQRKEQGFTAVKMNLTGPTSPVVSNGDLAAASARIEAALDALGEGRDVAVDIHGRLTVPSAKRALAAIDTYGLLFAEEPLRPELTERLDSVTGGTTPIALGERLYSRWDFLPAFQRGIAIAQPDVSHAGGISEVRRIAAVAETFDIYLAPHCPLGPVALAASVQIALASPNFLIQEYGFDMHYNDGHEAADYLLDTRPLELVDGHIERLTEPGLGISIDEAAVRRAASVGHTYRLPMWRRDDGSLTEW